MFIGRELLHFSEEEFWNCTPIKYFALIESAQTYQKLKYGSDSLSSGSSSKKGQPVQDGYIDQLPGW